MFSLHPPRVQSDLDMIVTRQRELRNTSSHAYLIQYMKELDSDEKVGNDESCHVYSLPVPFIPVPNACKLLMIPTVKWKQQIWLCQALSCGVWLLAACWGFTVRGTNGFITPLSFLSKWGRGRFTIYYHQSERIVGCFENSFEVSQFDVVPQSETNSVLHLSLIWGNNSCLVTSSNGWKYFSPFVSPMSDLICDISMQ